MHQESPALLISEAVPLDLIGHPLHIATLPNLRDRRALPNTSKQRPGGTQNEKMKGKKKSQIKEQKKTPENELNKMEACNLLDAEFKTLVIWMVS